MVNSPVTEREAAITTRAQFRDSIRSWVNFAFDDTLVNSWIDMAIERINNELRHKDMIERDVGLMTDEAVYLPADWLELVYVRFVGEEPARFVTNDEFWLNIVPERTNFHLKRAYTIVGNAIHINPLPDPAIGKPVEISYYKELPPYSETDTEGENLFYEKYPRLITFATLSMSAPYLVEDERVGTWEQQAKSLIDSMTAATRIARFSGSPLNIRIRSFG